MAARQERGDSYQRSSSEPKAWRRTLARLSSGYRVPKYQLIEVSQFERHILARIATIENTATNGDTSRRKDWIASRFTYPLRELMLKASRNGRSNVLPNLAVVGGGFAASGVAIGNQGNITNHTAGWAVFVIGLLVALAGGLNQLYRPGYRATERSSLVLQLEEEDWAFANG
jgi:hypothetical protein